MPNLVQYAAPPVQSASTSQAGIVTITNNSGDNKTSVVTTQKAVYDGINNLKLALTAHSLISSSPIEFVQDVGMVQSGSYARIQIQGTFVRVHATVEVTKNISAWTKIFTLKSNTLLSQLSPLGETMFTLQSLGAQSSAEAYFPNSDEWKCTIINGISPGYYSINVVIPCTYK